MCGAGTASNVIRTQDITSLKQAQEQALQSARLAAIGQRMTGLVGDLDLRLRVDPLARTGFSQYPGPALTACAEPIEIKVTSPHRHT